MACKDPAIHMRLLLMAPHGSGIWTSLAPFSLGEMIAWVFVSFSYLASSGVQLSVDAEGCVVECPCNAVMEVPLSQVGLLLLFGICQS